MIVLSLFGVQAKDVIQGKLMNSLDKYEPNLHDE